MCEFKSFLFRLLTYGLHGVAMSCVSPQESSSFPITVLPRGWPLNECLAFPRLL